MPIVTVPTTAQLSPLLHLERGNEAVSKILSRLSRASLLSLVLDWLDDRNLHLCHPYMMRSAEDEDEEHLYPAMRSVEELREHYGDLRSRKSNKKPIVDRIIEGDWRLGLTLHQLAMADLQYLADHADSQKWTAFRIIALNIPSPHEAADTDESCQQEKDKDAHTIVPRFHPATFLGNLQAQTLPDVKMHATFDRHKDLPILFLRILVVDSPYNTPLATSSSCSVFESWRTVYIAFPDASPYIYLSRPQTFGIGGGGTGKTTGLRHLLAEGISRALSMPRQRYALRATNLATRNLEALLERRGAGRTNAAGGGWGIYAADDRNESPLDRHLDSAALWQLLTPPPSDGSDMDGGGRKRAVSPAAERELRTAKRARQVAQARFGDSAKMGDGKGVERLDVLMEDAYHTRCDQGRQDVEVDEEEDAPVRRWGAQSSRRRRSALEADSERVRGEEGQDGDNDDGDSNNDAAATSWRPNVRLTLHGPHVFAGVRQLVVMGVIDGTRMPGWMTGEEGVTIGAVRHGRIRGNKGSAM